jgi:RND family efflux transporter MFP subunit
MFSPLLFLAACHQKSERVATPARPLPTAHVRVQKAESQPFVVSEEVMGTVRAKNRATLEAKQTGRIETLRVKLGDKVRCGDLIAEVEAGEIKARVEQAAASLEQAERDWRRVSSLFDASSATRSERDAGESRLRVARANLAEARASLAQMTIVAPFDGVVTKKWADAGDLATPGKPLVDIENASLLQVEIDIPESVAGKIEQNSKLSVVGESGVPVTGIVTEISPAFDPKTRTRQAKVELKNGSFASGQFVRVWIPSEQTKAILLPKTAVVERGQLEMVFTKEGQHARMRLIKSRSHRDANVEVLAGLSAGESVIVEGAEQLTDGQPVEVK